MRISKRCKGLNKHTDKVICTYDVLGQKCSGSGDSGGPLVVNGQLVGVLSYRLQYESSVFFMNVTSPEYKKWITSNIPKSEFPIGPSAAQLRQILIQRARPNIFYQGWANSREYLLKKVHNMVGPCLGQPPLPRLDRLAPISSKRTALIQGVILNN